MEAEALESAESGTLKIRIEGEAIEPGKVAVRDLTKLGELIQSGLERVARVLGGEPGGVPGPPPAPIRQATELLLAGIESGSATLILELPPPKETDESDDRLFEPPPRDLGLLALDRLVEGMHELESGVSQVPEGWDNSVMEIAEKLAETVSTRNFRIDLDRSHPNMDSDAERASRPTSPTASPSATPPYVVPVQRGASLLPSISGRVASTSRKRGVAESSASSTHRSQLS
jgi:hypothetical protein